MDDLKIPGNVSVDNPRDKISLQDPRKHYSVIMNPVPKNASTLRPSCALPKAYKLPSLGSGMNIALKRKIQNITNNISIIARNNLTSLGNTLQLALCLYR